MAKKKLTFEESMERLEEIVEKLEQEEVSLDEAVAFYKEGLTLSAFCKEKLAVAEGDILLLRKEAGLWQEEPFQTEEQEI
ncbi:exodeoxyribonuclease VII small subunit [Anaerotignum sp.]|uniref:exodeoxyribonuclease VII small subunit n=1 Tax=Anaerotignum sp. TaxID=2039241 RepID=UPI0028B14360|nr:exodeoxyribonuclease VII small subunit [Anaerotignum sp.]